MNGRLKAAGLGALFVAASLIAAELLVRALAHPPPKPDARVPGLAPPAREKGGGILTYDPVLLWKAKPNSTREMRSPNGVSVILRTNSLGLRSHEFPRKKAGRHYWILVLGNSPVWGELVKGEETFTSVLEDTLAAKARHVSVEALNAGMPDYCSFQARELERRLLKDYRFDLVIISLMGSDWIPAPVMPRRGHAIQRVLFRSVLYGMLAGFVHSHHHGGVRVPARPDFEDNLVEMVRMAQSQDADVVLLEPLPLCTEESCLRHDPGFLLMHDSYRRLCARMKRLEPQYQEAMRRAADRTGAVHVTLADSLHRLPSPASLYADVSHPNPAGHRLIAEALAPLVERLLRKKCQTRH